VLSRLLGDLKRERPDSFKLFVFDDSSSVDMAEAQQRCLVLGGRWHRFPKNHGKRLSWKMFTKMFAALRAGTDKHTLYFFFDDDMRLCTRFFERARQAWDRVADRRKITMHLMVDSSRKSRPCWTNFLPQDAGHGIRLIQWVDGSFMCQRRFFELLEWQVNPISSRRWKQEPTASTGVGMQLSTRLLKKGCKMYQVSESLLVHSGAPSKMNPNERASTPLHTVNFVDGNEEQDRLTKEGA
jgi:hypothetical protein